MKVRSLCRSIVTFGPIGYVIAPGTAATIVSAPLALWVMSHKWPLVWLVPFAFCSLFFSVVLIRYVLPNFKKNDQSYYAKATKDPSEIVLDEFVGCLFLFFNMPLSLPIFFIGIIIFRILDVFKLFGLRYVERIDGAWGIVLDDVCAGIMSNLLLRVVLLYI